MAKDTKDAPPAPLWQRIKDLEARRDGLRRQLDGAEDELLALAQELSDSVKSPGPPVAAPVKRPGAPGPKRRASTFTARVLDAMTEEMGPRDLIAKLGIKAKDRRRVYDVLKKEAARTNGRVRRTTMGAFEPRSP